MTTLALGEMLNKVHCMDAAALCRLLPDESINCVVTSPPYFGLRDYGIDGQIGLEPTPAEYVEKLVALFREIRRVLRDDGTVFLNLGDSYFGSSSPSNAQRATSYGTSGKEPVDCQDHGCLCENLCDVCRVVYRNRKSHSDGLLVAMLTASLSATNHENRESLNGHFPTLDSTHRGVRNQVATQASEHFEDRANGRLRASLASMIGESFPQLLDACLLRHELSECLLCARSLTDYAEGFVRKSNDGLEQSQHKSRNVQHDGQQMRHSQCIDTACEYCKNVSCSPSDIQPHCTTSSLKSKSLMGIPWRVAFGLQDDGWILRSEIIWAKPNPMPESVTDRPTKAHETIFLLTKCPQYFYDADAIREPQSKATLDRSKYPRGRSQNGGGSIESMAGYDYNRSVVLGNMTHNPNGRNKRSVWTVSTEATPFAHFACFPRKLITPMILAGCPVGGVVYDPFMGSGTTALVARDLGRQYIGSELNPEYVALANGRLSKAYTPPLFSFDGNLG